MIPSGKSADYSRRNQVVSIFSLVVFIVSLTEYSHPHSTQSNCRSKIQSNLSPSPMNVCFKLLT
jgi:hypothetical protein